MVIKLINSLPNTIKTLLKGIVVLVLLLMVFFPINSFAADVDSVTYAIAGKMLDVTEHFSLAISASIAGAFKVIFIPLATLGIIFIFAKYLFTRNVPLLDTFYLFLALTISSQIAFNPGLFKFLIYDTFFETLYALDKFIIQSVGSNLPGISTVTFNGLAGMFKTVDMTFMSILKFCGNIISDSNLFTKIPIMIQAFILYFLYLFLGAYFLVIFTVSIFSAHMMIVLLPIAISIYPFRRFRNYTTNLLQGLLHYGLISVFACIAIGIVIFMCNDLSREAADLTALKKGEIPAGFLIQAIMTSFLGIFLLKISSEIAMRVSNTSSSQIGGAFPMVIGGAIAVAKGSAVAAPIIARGGYKAALGATAGVTTAWKYGEVRAKNFQNYT